MESVFFSDPTGSVGDGWTQLWNGAEHTLITGGEARERVRERGEARERKRKKGGGGEVKERRTDSKD